MRCPYKRSNVNKNDLENVDYQKIATCVKPCVCSRCVWVKFDHGNTHDYSMGHENTCSSTF